MRKQIAFYVGWVLIFFVYLRLCDASHFWMLKYLRKNYKGDLGGFFPSVLMDIGLLLMFGIIVSLLVYVSFQFKLTRKAAFVELLIIGIPSLYLVSLKVTIFMAYIGTMGSFIKNLPEWLLWLYSGPSTETYATIGCILFGYEMTIFTIRMIQCRKISTASESE